ncbi:hypothetical protein [Piscinibacter sp. HJYY11]|uniref:hypothetical protein n=1 Tax=Piscinibacter sp. HJYY11 TaxID=2801333 RepID=UPI00191D4887|nr:hypothetical protein [Piscinibacter sp. HJYY11]MBL0729409.1 hypothetical protein [Piscinibacter sp. HJYY11]
MVKMRESSPRRALLSALVGLVVAVLMGCANVASRTPEEVVAGVAKNSDLRITWLGPESENELFGFPVIERQLEPIYEKCRQQQGNLFPVRNAVRFAGPSVMRDHRPEFVRTVTTEIRCTKGELYLWIARINYNDHRFYQDIQNRDRIQLTLRTSFVAGETLNPPQDEESKRRRAEAAAAAEKRYAEEAAQRERERQASREALAERERAAAEQRRAELPAFRARLKPGDRVRVLHPQFRSVSAIGLVIDVKPGLAQVQFRAAPSILNPDPKTETLWFQLEQLVQPDR